MAILRRVLERVGLRSQKRDPEVARLKARVRRLRKRLEAIQTRQAVRPPVLAPKEVFDDFLAGSHVQLPQASLQAFLASCRSAAGDEAYARYVEHLEQTGYRELYERVFAVEIETAANFSFRTLTFVSAFQRGRNDEVLATLRGQTFEERYASKFEIIRKLFDEQFRDLFEGRTVRSVVEVGSAWGATTTWVKDVCKPERYETYEIDRHSAERLSRALGTIPMMVDGETLSGTESSSMDLFVCNNVFFFMPAVKVFSYLDEADRVLRRGGIVLFNVMQTETLDREAYKAYLMANFPKRVLNDTPRNIIDKVMSPDRYRTLRTVPMGTVHYHVFEKIVD
jgi:predicted O-methyltransferase YrrM